MRNDDLPIGRLLTRREALALVGASGAALLGGAFPTSAATGAQPGCVVRPTQTEGPFFVDGSGANTMRLTFAKETDERITEGIARLAAVFA